MANKREKSDEKIIHIQKSVDDIKRRELEQTQELLVGLTNELFDKVEKMSTSKEKSRNRFDSNQELFKAENLAFMKRKEKT